MLKNQLVFPKQIGIIVFVFPLKCIMFGKELHLVLFCGLKSFKVNDCWKAVLHCDYV